MSLPTSLTAIDTPRLRLLALPLAQLRLCLDDLPALEAELGMSISQGVFSLRVQRAIGMKIDKMQKAEPARHEWFTYWLAVIKAKNLGAGLAGFKGYPDAAGKSEIGYGLDPAYQGQGYMSEAVRALVDWALQHPDCKAVTATGVIHPASRRLLEKLGARLVEESGQGSSWEIRQASSK